MVSLSFHCTPGPGPVCPHQPSNLYSFCTVNTYVILSHNVSSSPHAYLTDSPISYKRELLRSD